MNKEELFRIHYDILEKNDPEYDMERGVILKSGEEKWQVGPCISHLITSGRFKEMLGWEWVTSIEEVEELYVERDRAVYNSPYAVPLLNYLTKSGRWGVKIRIDEGRMTIPIDVPIQAMANAFRVFLNISEVPEYFLLFKYLKERGIQQDV